MASTSGHAAVVNFQEALGYNGLPLSRFNAPASLLQDSAFRKLVLAYVGRSRRALDDKDPDYPHWPEGLSFGEKAYGHTLSIGLEAGHGNNWLLLTQLTPPAFPNKLSKEEYVRLAVLELLEKANQSQQVPVRIPRRAELSRAEKAEVRLLRTRVLDGREIRWAEFLDRRGEQYPNRLSSLQLLALAAGLPSNESGGEEEAAEEVSDTEYFTASEE